ncbi:snRNA-activating protein complex subunit 4 isoform X2 [Heptranchias perlo]|uniref:snRNA-activating protein complex subunit 4 isoform X2 n=1 Tax=Heptranchias perlo TaxID=212740 RepID=UPI003559F08A
MYFCGGSSQRGDAPQLPDNNMGEEGDDLPEDPETCLQMNLVYQEVIVEKLQDLELLLTHNKEQQTGIMWDMAGHGLEKTKATRGQAATMYLGHFMKPYFRDRVTGLGPPANQDTKEKATQGIKTFEEFFLMSWKQRDKEKLRHSIASDSTQRLLQPKLLRLEYLNKKLKLSRVEADKKTLRKQIGETERGMDKINQMTQRQLLGNRFDDHDWIKIANIDFDGSRKAEDIKSVWQNSEHPSISRAEWSSEEVERLMEIVERAGCVDWQWIASELQTNRTAYMCLQKYQELNKDRRKEWTAEEDQMLTELVQKMRVGNFIPYTKIAYFMEGRNSSQLLYHWSKSLDPTVKRGPWSRAEDALLLKAVAKYGTRDWFKIQEGVPGRVDVQCRGRFLNGLNRTVRRGKWTPEEERDLKALIEKHGVGKWSKIAAELSVRTETQCLSKWKCIAGLRCYKKDKTKGRRRRRRRRRSVKMKWESSTEESSEESSEEEDVKFQEEEEEEEEEEQQQQQEDPEEAQELERKKRRVRRRKPAESIVLDVDRWVPVVENEAAAPGEKPGDCQGSKTATGQLKGSWKVEGQNNFGRPKSSKIWKSVVPSVSEQGERLKERESATQAGAPESDTPSEPVPCPAEGDEVLQEPPQTRGERKKAKRRACSASLSEKSLDKRLLVEMSRWTAARPVSQREVDILRERLEATGLSSTPVFTLLIQVLQIDKEGCMKIIRDKMNRDAQRSSENKQPGGKVRRGPYLRKVKDNIISIGNGRTMEINRFKLSSEPPTVKPRTVQEMLAEKRRVTALRLLGAPRQLIIQQAVLAQPAASPSEGPVGPAPRESEQTHPTSPIHTRASRRDVKPVAPSAVRRSKRVLVSSQLAAAEEPEATPPPPPQCSQIQPAATAKPTRNLQPASSNMNVAPVKPGTANPRAQRLQRIAPAPAPQPKGVLVPLMLPNSTMPVMAVLTPQGLLCIPPATHAGQPKSNNRSLAGQVAPHSSNQAGAAVISVVPLGGASGTTVQAPAGSIPASGEANLSAQSAVDCPIESVPTTSGAKPAPTLPLTSPSPAVCSSTPPLSSSLQIRQIQAPAPPARSDAGSLTPCLPVLGAIQQPVANRVDPTVSAPPRTVNLNQGAAGSWLVTWSEVVPGAGCLSTNQGIKPGSLAQHERTYPPTARSQSDKSSIDFKLLSHEQEAVMKDWLHGEGGIHVPGLPTTLPYLPPFASTLRAFSNLLLHKKVLERNLSGFMPADGREATDPKARLETARALVGDHLQNNPAHQLLKARFLSAFTLPAFLATLPPRGTRTTVGQSTGALGQESADESDYEDCTETDGESMEDSEGSEEQCDTDEVANRELNQPFEISFTDLSFDCNLAGSLETIVEDQTAPEPSGAPESGTEMPTRRSSRLRKKP